MSHTFDCRPALIQDGAQQFPAHGSLLFSEFVQYLLKTDIGCSFRLFLIQCRNIILCHFSQQRDCIFTDHIRIILPANLHNLYIFGRRYPESLQYLHIRTCKSPFLKTCSELCGKICKGQDKYEYQ